ncbi:hypothetical protein CBL_00276 [Carabus blaptoides fortunei]
MVVSVAVLTSQEGTRHLGGPTPTGHDVPVVRPRSPVSRDSQVRPPGTEETINQLIDSETSRPVDSASEREHQLLSHFIYVRLFLYDLWRHSLEKEFTVHSVHGQDVKGRLKDECALCNLKLMAFRIGRVHLNMMIDELAWAYGIRWQTRGGKVPLVTVRAGQDGSAIRDINRTPFGAIQYKFSKTGFISGPTLIRSQAHHGVSDVQDKEEKTISVIHRDGGFIVLARDI